MSRQIPLCYPTEAAVRSLELAAMLRQIHYLAARRGAVIREDRKWFRMKYRHWRKYFPSWRVNTPRPLVTRGRLLGILETRRDIEPGMLYAINYHALAMLMRVVGVEIPKWLLDGGVPKTTDGTQLDILVHQELEEAAGALDTERVRVRNNSFRSEKNSHFEVRNISLLPYLPSPLFPSPKDFRS